MAHLLSNKKLTICSFCNQSTAWVINLTKECRELAQQMPLCSWNCAASVVTEMRQHRKLKDEPYQDIMKMIGEEIGFPVVTQRPPTRDKPAGKVKSAAQYASKDPKRETGIPPSAKLDKSAGAPAAQKQGVTLAKALAQNQMIVSAKVFPWDTQRFAPVIDTSFRVQDWQDSLLQGQYSRRMQLIFPAQDPPFILLDDGPGQGYPEPQLNHRATEQLAGMLGTSRHGPLFGNVMQIPYEGLAQHGPPV